MDLTPEDRIKVSQAIASCWAMPEFKERFLSAPREVLAELGVQIPPEVEVRVVADTPEAVYVILPRPDLPEFLAAVLPGAIGRELRLVQNDERHLYLPLPIPPSGLVSAMQTGLEGMEP